MKKIILSFQADYFRPLLYGLKKYEYRKAFCHEPVLAFLYLTKPVSEFVGVLELGQRFTPDEILEAYEKDPFIQQRMKRCLQEGEKAIIPIIRFNLFKEPLSLLEIRTKNISFSVPRAFKYLDANHPLFSLLEARETYPSEFYHAHEKIYEENIGVKCLEMEETLAFKKRDALFLTSQKVP